MLSLSQKQKNEIKQLSGGRNSKWTEANAKKAVKITYGKYATFIKFDEPFCGNNTKGTIKCNLCDKIRHVTLRSLLYYPTCSRCNFKGHCNRLSYDIIQKRLIVKHRPILIFPFYNHPYKNNETKFMAYDYKHHESWVTCSGRLQEGKGAPNYKHKMGYLKERIPLSHYQKLIKRLFHNHLTFRVLKKYIGRDSLILVYDKIRDDYLIITINHLLQHKSHMKYRFIHRSLSYLKKKLIERFKHNIHITFVGNAIGVDTQIKGTLYGKSFNTTVGNLLKHTDNSILSSAQIKTIKFFNHKYGTKHKNLESQISRAKFGYNYSHQQNIYIPKFPYIMKHYSTDLRFRAFGLHDKYGHNPKEPWITTSDLLQQNHWNTKIANIHKRTLQVLHVGLHAFIHWYKHQNKIFVPQFKRIVKRYYGNRMIIHCICAKCGYGKHGEWTETINKLLTGTQCPKCSHSLPITISVAHKRINKMYHGAVSFTVPNNKLVNGENTYIHVYNKKVNKHYTTTLATLLSGHAYMYDSVSKGECAMGIGLRKLGFVKQNDNHKLPINNHYVYSYIFKNCSYKNHLHADFIVNINGHYIVIEYDGCQHFTVTNYPSDDERNLIIRQGRDHLKNHYCRNKKNFDIIRIQDKKNLDKMSSIKKLVHRGIQTKLLPLIHKYSHTTQLSLF